MTHLIVRSEYDMERSIKEATILAEDEDKTGKRLEITFSSEGMANIFMSNLFITFVKRKISPDNGLNILLNIPSKGDFSDE